MSDLNLWKDQELAHGRYQLLDKLGEGGMGIVYRARDRNLGTDVVIKAPRFIQLGDDQAAQRFLREIRSLVALAHPHVVRILDVGEHEGLPFAVMEYLAGGSLKTRRPLGGDGRPLPQPPETLQTWLPDIAAALDYTHRKGYVHRDVKPDNILFDANGNVYLSDFGIVKGLVALTATSQTTLTGVGAVVGTPGYIAPELLLGRPCDGRADQYSLAITVYEILAGRRLFEGLSPIEIAMRQIESPMAPEQVFPGIADRLRQPLQIALNLDREQRHGTCEAFARALLAAISPSPAAPVVRPASPQLAATTPWYPPGSAPPNPGIGEDPFGATTLAAQQVPLAPGLPAPPPAHRRRRISSDGGNHLRWALVALAGVAVLCVILLIVLFTRGPANRKTANRSCANTFSNLVAYGSSSAAFKQALTSGRTVDDSWPRLRTMSCWSRVKRFSHWM